jgi:hypothetical protein
VTSTTRFATHTKPLQKEERAYAVALTVLLKKQTKHVCQLGLGCAIENIDSADNDFDTVLKTSATKNARTSENSMNDLHFVRSAVKRAFTFDFTAALIVLCDLPRSYTISCKN